MKIAVAIFAKTIGLSCVKTRLAADIGVELAEAFYTLSISCVYEMMSLAVEACDHHVSPHWVLAEKDGPKQFASGGFPAIWTGDGDLGTRLANVSEHLSSTFDGVIMIGTDSPQLGYPRMVDAVTSLAGYSDSCIAGPAIDGGFYLFGARQPISRKDWESVTYSSDSTLSELVGKIETQGREVKFLPTEQDVDVVDDLSRLKKTLSNIQPAHGSSQARLLQWLCEHSDFF